MPNLDGGKDNEASAAKPKRVRTGCLTCRERHLKCDEVTPLCNNCRKSNRECKRGVRLNFIDTWVAEPPTYLTQYGTSNWQVVFLDESREIAGEYQGGLQKYKHCDQDVQELRDTSANPFASHSEANRNAPTSKPQQPPAALATLPDPYPSVDAHLTLGVFEPQVNQDLTQFSSQLDRRQSLSGSVQMSSGLASNGTLAPGSVASYGGLDNDLQDLEGERKEFLTDHDETLYMQVFVEEVGLWMDSMDPQKHFSRLLPFHALSEPMLLNAFLACGARHLVLVNSAYSEEKALHYYDTATRFLLKNLQNPLRDTVICATTAVILNVYEIMSERALQRMNHIAGARALIKECGWNARAQGIGAACFWLNVGLEVLSCLHFNWQVAWDPDDWGLDLNFTREVHNGREELWTQRMLYIVAKVCNFRAATPKSKDSNPHHEQRRLQKRCEEWTRLKSMCEAWNDGIPRTMHPMAFLYPYQTRNRSCFPEVWLVKRTTTVARLFFHTAMLLLAQVHPYLDASNTDMADLIIRHSQMICGIAAHLKDRGVASVAIRSLAHAAEVLTDRKEQEEVITIFERINRETGWRIGFVYKELKERWAWNEAPSSNQSAQTHTAAKDRLMAVSRSLPGSASRNHSVHSTNDIRHDTNTQTQSLQQQHNPSAYPPQSVASSSSSPSSSSTPHHKQRQPSVPFTGTRNPMYAKADFSLPHHPYQNFYVAPSSSTNPNSSMNVMGAPSAMTAISSTDFQQAHQPSPGNAAGRPHDLNLFY